MARRVTVPVDITIQIPVDLEGALRRELANDPDFLDRIVLLGLARRNVYHHLRERGVAE